MSRTPQWPHSAAGCSASGCEFRVRDNPCCPCSQGWGRWGEEQWLCPCRGRQWLTQPLKPQRMPGTGPEPWITPWQIPPIWPSSCSMVPRDWGDDTFKDSPWASEGLDATLKDPQNWVLPLWAVDWLRRGLLSRQTEVSSTQPQQQIAWLRRAPQGRAPSGSGGKRRTLDSWIRLANSLEATKKKGAR